MIGAPLAERVRPRTLDQVAGQHHLVGPGAILRTSIESGKLPSLILWGPPGTGKTTLAQIMAQSIGRTFIPLSAISAGVKEVREAITLAGKAGGAVLFIDEIHRFNKGQQDALLGAVERGVITLIGATTENPSFEINSALLSRCQVYVLRALEAADLEGLMRNAFVRDEWLASSGVALQETGALIQISGGDARKLLNLLELVTTALVEEGGKEITDEAVMRIAQQRIALYDKSGEQHYDIISAFIKSMRGSDPNGAVYWLARMIEGGEDVLFIARRMVIFASEDIGNANPTALVLANAAHAAVHTIGNPEARIILAQCATYLASSSKSNASYVAIEEALEEVRKGGDKPVPLHLRNAVTTLMKGMGYGKEYKYAHDFEGNFTELEFLPEGLEGTAFYQPGPTAREEELRKFLRSRWNGKYGY